MGKQNQLNMVALCAQLEQSIAHRAPAWRTRFACVADMPGEGAAAYDQKHLKQCLQGGLTETALPPS